MNVKHILKTLSITMAVLLVGALSRAFAFCGFFCELPDRGGSQGVILGNNLISFALITGLGILGYRIFISRKKSKKNIRSNF